MTPEEAYEEALRRRAEDGVRYQAYQLWEFAEWEYSRSRAQFKALIAFCERARSSGLILFTGGIITNWIISCANMTHSKGRVRGPRKRMTLIPSAPQVAQL